MVRTLKTGTDELVQRAQDDVAAREHRYIYSESTPAPGRGYAVRPNKKGTVRKVSTFYIIVALVAFGASTVAYVNNVIVVNRLATEINQRQSVYNKICNTNAVLRSEINRKSAWERIGKIAGEQTGLRFVKDPPVLFDVDEDLMDRARQIPDKR